jgi:hypothetical protein
MRGGSGGKGPGVLLAGVELRMSKISERFGALMLTNATNGCLIPVRPVMRAFGATGVLRKRPPPFGNVSAPLLLTAYCCCPSHDDIVISEDNAHGCYRDHYLHAP